MGLKEVEGLPGPPWNRRLQGHLDVLVVESGSSATLSAIRRAGR